MKKPKKILIEYIDFQRKKLAKMTEKDILELQNIYTIAAQNAKKNNKIEYKLEMQENVFVEFKKSFPKYER